MADIYFKDNAGTIYNDTDLKLIILNKYVPDFCKQTLIQDEIPYTNQKVTYGRKRENRIIGITVTFDVNTIAELNEKVAQLNQIFNQTFHIGFIEDGFEYECNLIEDIEQEDIKKHIKKYIFTFETTTPERTVIT